MATINIDETRRVMKIFSQNLPVISALFPNKNLNLSEISAVSGWDVGTVSKSVRALIDNRLIYIIREVKGSGKPQKILGLTEFAYKLYATVKEYLEKEYVTRGQANKTVIDEYFDMLSSEDDDVRKLAADGLFNESTRNVFPDEGHLIQLKEKIFDPQYVSLKKELLQTLVNLATNTDIDKKSTLEDLFAERLKELFNEKGDGTDHSENIRILALKAFTAMLNLSSRFQVLAEVYLKLVEEGSTQTPSVRGLIMEKCSDHLADIKLMFLRRYSSSNGETRKRIGDELRQL